MTETSRQIDRLVTGSLFVVAGAFHFISPAPYLAMMSPYLPQPGLLVQLSGVAEILGGLGVLWAVSRRMAAWGLMLLLLAVFPANLHVALHGWPGTNFPTWILWARLPLQLVMLWWVYRVFLRNQPGSSLTLQHDTPKN